MGISLKKGESINLTKKSPGLTKVFMGLGWDPIEQKKGLIGKIFSSGSNIDLDASVITFDRSKSVIEIIYYGELTSSDGSIRHGGDNLTGEGDGDDEVIYLDLNALPNNVEYLVFTVNSFQGQTFDSVENSFARLVDDTNQNEICRYDLKEQGSHTGVIMASLVRGSDGWVMNAHGRPCNGQTAHDITDDARSVI